MEAIAAEAGVAVRTVYSAFGNKREILSLICERWLEHAHARERAQQVFAVQNPARKLRAVAGWLRNLYEAGFDVVLIFEAATDESPETRALLRSKLVGRNEVMDAMIASLEGHLRVPVRQAQAVRAHIGFRYVRCHLRSVWHDGRRHHLRGEAAGR